ncbi:ATP-dependent endonuclease [Agromyces sp. ISL-38]|uniref:TOPRIM nucleotidyl transferase/hydrolase domain-containing protein n=1 Tax=Agromyces sp. ISL-38 TaxID=2819107 RepID=UPI001BEA3198|nr:TOPRIM nucleotidyl transferase/hydrolase domain-containing protein [Agromyces sp. ISL-38]MBT2497608.1 ATP-dependent endonuclease [Agromyces sp. ISL-38]MBT2517301.1 ATP-dependent endonuclease [Streptomyces sp. ISL-90]
MRGGERNGASATVVLVEGESDRLAVETLAARLGCDLVAADATVVSMGGVTNLRRHLAELSAAPVRPRVLGLFDAGELAYVHAVVERDGLRDAGAGIGAGGGTPGTLAGLASLGYFACEPDLEGELIRALGTDRVEQLLAEHGELTRFRGFQQQPAQRSRATDAQLRRFMGTHSGRKARFAPILVDALEESRIPVALAALVAAVGDGAA